LSYRAAFRLLVLRAFITTARSNNSCALFLAAQITTGDLNTTYVEGIANSILFRLLTMGIDVGKMAPLARVTAFPRDMLDCAKQHTAGAAGWIIDALTLARIEDFYHHPYDAARRVEFASFVSAGDVGELAEEIFISVAENVCADSAVAQADFREPLSPVTGLSCHRRLRMIFANLTPASGRQDHTTSPSADQRVRQRAIHVHRIPPHVRDDRETPLWEAGHGWNIAVSTGASS
jgi:hypothetical protein